jgi:VWFA-related protein
VRSRMLRQISVAFASVVLSLASIAQIPPQPQPSPDANNSSSQSAPTFHAYTRMVTLEVVAKDRHGNHVNGLKASDFQVFEQSETHKDKRNQEIASFREIQFADLVKQRGGQMQVPAGVYTNAVTLQKNPVPPTILLIDGLNTDLKDQAQLQVQMQRILDAIPSNVPVAIFVCGYRLRMLQDFTSDPKVLQLALKKAFGAAGRGVATIDPRDDPNQISAHLDSLAGGNDAVGAAIRGLGALAQEVELAHLYPSQMKLRVDDTTEALVSIARYIAGYPGRKNLLWISSAFPISLDTHFQPTGMGREQYDAQIWRITNALSDAKVAVYPVNPAGVQPHALFEAETRPRDYSGQGTADTLSREINSNANKDTTMRSVAEATGGVPCIGDNDLGDCIRKAVDDSSSFYEIAYYPDSAGWNGEYRKIVLQSKRSGLQLEYRHGYFAGVGSHENQKGDLQQAACEGYLTATSIFFAATRLPASATGELKFYLGIDPAALTLLPTSDGGRELNINVAVCTFDSKGTALQLMSEPLNRKLAATEYQSITHNGLPHIVSIPGPKPSAVRLLIRDVPTGRIGSVHINVEDNAPPAPTATASKPPVSH